MTEEVRRFLEEPRFAVFATSGADCTPHQTVLWYELRGDKIILNTSLGRAKVRNLRRHPKASFCVEDGYRYVSIAGTVELIDDQDRAHEDIRRLAIRYHGPEKGEEMARNVYSKQQRVTLVLNVESVIAKDI